MKWRTQRDLLTMPEMEHFNLAQEVEKLEMARKP
jgi:hypothetical protein